MQKWESSFLRNPLSPPVDPILALEKDLIVQFAQQYQDVIFMTPVDVLLFVKYSRQRLERTLPAELT